MYKILFLGSRWNSGNYKTRHAARRKLRKMIGYDFYKPLGFSIQKV